MTTVVFGARGNVGAQAAVSALVSEVTGRPARTLAEWAPDHVAGFRVPKPVP